jgi:hypothetical protein
VKELATYFLKNGGGNNFVFGNITVLDFYFIQGARQTLAFFACIDEKVTDKRWVDEATKYRLWRESRGEIIGNTNILRGIKIF